MVANRIAKLRERRGPHGITQAHLARALGVTRSHICRIEAGKVVPSGKIMFKLAQYFECQIEDIFRFNKPKSKR